MTTIENQARPKHCYCRKQDEEMSLNEIAKIINALNLKILRLRNEVTALKDVDSDEDKKQFKKSEPAYGQCSSKCDVKCDKFMPSEESKALAEFFKSNSSHARIIKPKVDYDTTDANDSFNEEKKISRGIQCEIKMDRKRKRIFLNCFKSDNYVKANKKMKFSSPKIHVPFGPNDEANSTNTEEQDNRALQLEFYAHSEGNVASTDQTRKLINAEPKGEKLQESTIFKNFKSELAESKRTVDSTNDTEEKYRLFECSINRMGGGAEIRGNRLISDLHDKIQMINLYKNVKFESRNVKKRLDACIKQLNGIIEDVSLIFPNN